jgi:predicted membrane protein
MENFRKENVGRTGFNGRVLAGFVLLVVGVILFARQLGVELPYWLFRWEMFLIVLGVFIGAKDSFRKNGWMILVVIGCFFLLDDWIVDIRLAKFFWPTIILLAGAAMIVSPFKRRNWEKKYQQSANESDELIDINCFFGGVKKNIISKNFKGGQIYNIFGGVDLDLSQSDIDGVYILDVTQVFGGIKIIVPSHWEIKSEVVSILGGFEDKRRNLSALNISEGKTLIIKGTSAFAGIDIKSY